MRTQLTVQVNNLITTIYLTVLFFLPLLFLPLTTEFYETSKLIFLSLAVAILLILRTFSWVLEGKVLFTRSPFDIPLLLFLLALIASSIIPPSALNYSKSIAFFGNLPRVHGSTFSWIIYILFFFLSTSHFKSTDQVKTALRALIFSTAIVCVVTIASYFGIYPTSFAFTKFVSFTPTGSSFSTNALLVLLLPILYYSMLSKRGVIPQTISTALAILFAINIALTSDISIQIASILGLVGVFYLVRNSLETQRESLGMLAIPLIVFLLVSLLTLPLIGRLALLKDRAAAYNPTREQNLPFNISWKISASSFRDNPFFGTGPATYGSDFTIYKPIEINSTPLWGLRFDLAFNEFLQLLATVGALGFVAFSFFILAVLNFSWRTLKKEAHNPLVASVGLSMLLGVTLLLLHPSSLILIVVFFALLSFLVSLQRGGSEKVEELILGIKAWNPTRSELISGDALPGITFITVVAVIIFMTVKGIPLVLADYHHRLALNNTSTQAVSAYNEFRNAALLNPNSDLYHVDFAQVNFALANALAATKGPSPSSPSGSLSDADKQNIQTLLSQSINEGRVAVLLNPLSARNWEILASIYRQISGVAQNALQFSLDSYGRAIQRDPLNPLLRLSVGGVYYSVKNYDLAVRFFTDSVNLKPDFANGYYNLAVALRDKGDLQGAIASASQVVALVDKKSPDYSVAIKLLSDLKEASKSASQAQGSPPPAAAATSSLQQQNLPNVLNLPQPENIATPSAVKK